MQPRQTGGIAPIRLDPIARSLRDQRGRNHDAFVTMVALNAVAAWPCLLSFRHLVKWAWQRLLLLKTVHRIPLPEVTAFSSRFDAVIGAG
jgi:hypothetical protein